MKNKIRLMVAAAVALVLFVGAAWQAAAQEEGEAVDPAVQPLLAATITAVNRSFPDIGQPDRFVYTFTEATPGSSLGCPLIGGIELERPVNTFAKNDIKRVVV